MLDRTVLSALSWGHRPPTSGSPGVVPSGSAEGRTEIIMLEAICLGSLLLLAYIYFGYSALVVLLGQLRPLAGADTLPEPAPEVSLIIPAHNEAAIIREKVVNALAIAYPAPPGLEIIVASDGSTDATCELVRRFEGQGVRLLDFSMRRGKASVLNDAVAASRGELLCFCDANVMFRPDALARLVARLRDPGVGAVSGDVRLASHESNFEHGESLYYRLERAIQLGESAVGSLIGVDGGMYVVRRELFRPLPADTILDDFVISMEVVRRGARVVYEPAAVATENGTPTARIELRRRVRMAAGMVQVLKRGQFCWWRPVVAWQFVSHKLLRALAPELLLALLVSNLLLAPRHPLWLALLAGQAAFYLVALIGAVSVPFRRTRLGGIPFYFVMGHVAILYGSIKGLFNRQRVTWQVTERTPVAPASTLRESM